MSAILWSETFLTPALRLIDIGGFVQKHILAPRAMTQEQMNLNFLGTPYNLGERYTVSVRFLHVHDPRMELKGLISVCEGFDQSLVRVLLLFGPLSCQLSVWVCDFACPVSCRQILSVKSLGLFSYTG